MKYPMFATVLGACAFIAVATPKETVARSGNMSVRLEAAPGDTLRYRLNWGAAPGATSYRVAIRELWNPPGTYMGLTADTDTPTNTFMFTAISTTADSAQFRAVVWAQRGSQVNPDSSYVVWSVRRLGKPGPITVDSSLIVSAIELEPDNITLVESIDGINSVPFCALVRFHDGAVAYRSTNPLAYCDSLARTKGTLPRAPQQFIADTMCIVFEVISDSGGPATINQPLCQGVASVIFGD